MFENIPIVQSAISLGLAGMFGYAFRDLPSYGFQLFMQKFSVKIEVNSESYSIFNGTIKWLIEYFPEFEHHILFDGYNTLNTNISNGAYYFFPNKSNLVIVYKSRIEGQQHEIKHNLLIIILGKDRFEILDDYKVYIRNIVPDLKYNTHIIARSKDYYADHIIYKKSFDDVYFDKKDELIQLLDNFKKTDDIYIKHGLSKSIGILLYGPPGTGKTTIAKAIAAYLDWSIIFIKNNMEGLPTPSNRVILFEDIDTLITMNREDKDTLNDINHMNKIPLHEALNYLDGCLTPNNTIIVATTNYIDRLDPALIRDGRFDYRFEIKYMTKKLAKQMCDNFDVPYSLLNDIKFPISPAVVQNKILHHILCKSDNGENFL